MDTEDSRAWYHAHRSRRRRAARPCGPLASVSCRSGPAGRTRTLHRFNDRTKAPWGEDSYERGDPQLPTESPPGRACRVDVYGWLQIILRLRAGEILDLQHGPYR